jgi:Glycosyltransferase
MVVLQINMVYGANSTGRTCAELYEASKKVEGIELYTAYGTGPKSQDKHLYRIVSRPGYYMHDFMARVFGDEACHSLLATHKLIRFIKKIKPDVIHIRTLHGNYINGDALFKFLGEYNKPVIINLHDHWILTGHCPYPVLNKCDKYLKECHRCPAKKEYPQSWFFDTSKKMFRKKKKWISELRNQLYVIGVSKWSMDFAKPCFPVKTHFEFIYNWVDLEIFNPKSIKEVPLQLRQIPKQKMVVLSVAGLWEENSQKFQDLIAVQKLLSDDFIFVLVGGTDFNTKKYGKIIFVPFVSSKKELAALYSRADVYAHLSYADTFGKVVGESLASGTPAVVYGTTALPELVTDSTGSVVPLGDVSLFAKEVEKNASRKAQISSNCRERAKELFDITKNTNKVFDLYRRAAQGK